MIETGQRNATTEESKMTTALIIGDDYAAIFGLDPDKGQHLIYKGGNKWLAQQPGSEREMESEKTTQSALEYVNRPSIHMGPM